MNMVNINVLVPDVMGAKGLIGVPPQIVEDALRKTAIDFCTQSTIWEYHDHFLSQANVADYPLEVPYDARIASMRWVSVNGSRLVSNQPVASAPVMWGSMNPNSLYGRYGYTYTMEGREFLWVTPVPQDCDSTIEFSAALKPKQSSCQLPEFLSEDWNDALTAGAAYRLFSMPKQEWTNSGLAMLNQREYSRWIARARLTKMQNYTQGSVALTGSYF